MSGPHGLRAPWPVLLLVWSLPYLWVVAHAGRLPYNDYYGTLAKVVDGGSFTHDPLRWLTVKSNEHTVTVSALIYAANVALTRGDNRTLSAWAVAMMALTATGLWRLLPEELRHPGAPAFAAVLTVGGLSFTPAAIHNVVMGFSGVMWLTANALAVWAVVTLDHGGRHGGRAAPAVAAGLGLLAAFTYSTGIAVWPALVLVGAARRIRWQRQAPILLAALADLTFELVTYTRPAELPPPGTGSGSRLVAYLAAYLGGPFGLGWTSAAAGLAAMVAGIALVSLLWRRPAARRPLAPWLAVGTYALLNALGTAVGRIHVGGARSSRYATLAVLYWTALLVAGAWRAQQIPHRHVRGRVRAGLAAVVGILLVATWVRGVRTARHYLELAAGQPLAELALVHGVMDLEAFRAVYTAKVTPEQVVSVVRLLKSLHHVPFDRPPRLRYGEPLPGRITGPCPGVTPPAAGAVAVGGGVIRLQAVMRGSRELSRLALVDRRGRVVGAGVKMPAPWPGHPGWPRDGVRWAGYAAAGDLAHGVRVVRSGNGGWCTLGPLTFVAADP